METLAVIEAAEVSDAVCRLYSEISTRLRPDVLRALERAREAEESRAGRHVLDQLLLNAEAARVDGVPLCQDTGLAVVFAEMGRGVFLRGAALQQAVDEGVRRAAARVPLRASAVADPLDRRNTGDNTPAVVHLTQTDGDELVLHLVAKGGGAENMSVVRMLTPGAGRQGVVEAVVDAVREAGANPCPPVIVGVGLGGDFEGAALLAKRALLRDLDEPHPDADTAALEAEILKRVNALGIGPQGFGGRVTALAVLVRRAPCHIASMPLAVNVECHSHRHGSVTLQGRRVSLEL